MGQRSLIAPVVLKPVGTNEYCRGQWLLGPGKGKSWKHILVPAWPSMYFGGCLELERARTVIRPSWTMNSIQPHSMRLGALLRVLYFIVLTSEPRPAVLRLCAQELLFTGLWGPSEFACWL